MARKPIDPDDIKEPKSISFAQTDLQRIRRIRQTNDTIKSNSQAVVTALFHYEHFLKSGTIQLDNDDTDQVGWLKALLGITWVLASLRSGLSTKLDLNIDVVFQGLKRPHAVSNIGSKILNRVTKRSRNDPDIQADVLSYLRFATVLIVLIANDGGRIVQEDETLSLIGQWHLENLLLLGELLASSAPQTMEAARFYSYRDQYAAKQANTADGNA